MRGSILKKNNRTVSAKAVRIPSPHSMLSMRLRFSSRSIMRKQKGTHKGHSTCEHTRKIYFEISPGMLSSFCVSASHNQPCENCCTDKMSGMAAKGTWVLLRVHFSEKEPKANSTALKTKQELAL